MTIPNSSGYDDYMMENASIEIEFTCKAEEERRIVEEATARAEANLREGNLYYVISNRWFMAWQRYTGASLFRDPSLISESVTSSSKEDRPGPIDNTDIVASGGDNKSDDPKLLRTLEEGRDYVLVPQQVWDKLFKWYKGGPVLPRRMISVGDHQKQFCVEVFPLCLTLIDSRNQSEVVLTLSKKASLRGLYEKVCRLKGLDPNKARIWDYFNKQKHTILSSSNGTLEEANLQMDQDILLELPIADYGMDSTGNSLALVPVEPVRSAFSIEPVRSVFSIEPVRSAFSIAGGPTMSNEYSAGNSSNIHQTTTFTSSNPSNPNMEDGHDGAKLAAREEKGGLAGLQNLGNTCFMNSAIQCLCHTPDLVEYFLQDYSDEINRQNPLGLHGELAIAFGELLRKLWSSGRTPVAPRVFKGKLGRFAPQFSGYNQHDSQELLAFLLDGLHEDLNRVKKKPYIEAKDSDYQPDEEVADEFWKYHKARNDSVIVDICQGQYKSTLVCPLCKKISIAFDPFMYLSLPLPSTATRSMTVTVFYGDGSGLPMPFTVTVLKQGCCKDLVQALSTACCLRSDEQLLLAEVSEHRIYRYLENLLEPLASIKDNEHVVGYRLTKREANSTRLEICHRYQDNERKLFLTPLITILEEPQSGEDIYLAVDQVLCSLRRKTFLSSTVMHNSRENGSAEEQMSNSTHLESAMESTDDLEPQSMSSRELSFHLCITDDKGFGCRPLVKHSPIRPGHLVKVMLDWTSKEHELYDVSYLKDLPEVHKLGILAKKTKQEAISLFSCLDAFLKEEPLGPDDMWFCPRCKDHRQASKKLDLWRLPDVLILHLKRFSYSQWMKNKMDTFVNFPIHNLDLSKYVKIKDSSESSHVYELYAIINHYGSLGGGHYSAYCKLIDGNRWYHFDDAHVSPVNESEIKTSAAYVLFYQRVKTKANGSAWEPSF